MNLEYKKRFNKTIQSLFIHSARTENQIPNIAKPNNKIWTGITLAQSIWKQTEFRSVPNHQEECNYNQNPVQFNKTR